MAVSLRRSGQMDPIPLPGGDGFKNKPYSPQRPAYSSHRRRPRPRSASSTGDPVRSHPIPSAMALRSFTQEVLAAFTDPTADRMRIEFGRLVEDLAVRADADTAGEQLLISRKELDSTKLALADVAAMGKAAAEAEPRLRAEAAATQEGFEQQLILSRAEAADVKEELRSARTEAAVTQEVLEEEVQSARAASAASLEQLRSELAAAKKRSALLLADKNTQIQVLRGQLMERDQLFNSLRSKLDRTKRRTDQYPEEEVVCCSCKGKCFSNCTCSLAWKECTEACSCMSSCMNRVVTEAGVKPTGCTCSSTSQCLSMLCECLQAHLRCSESCGCKGKRCLNLLADNVTTGTRRRSARLTVQIQLALNARGIV